MESMTNNLNIVDSITTFKYLHEGKTNSESGDRNSTEIIVDDDCDLILPRKDIQNSLKIVHSQYTDIDNVGLQIWNGALLLADFIIYSQSKFEGKRVLELGSGTGFVGIIAAMYCDRVLCTDLNHAKILETIRQNFELNKHLLNAEYHICEFDISKTWTHDIQNAVEETDIVLFSELVYDDNITDHLVNTLAMIMRTKIETEIYFSVEKRYVFTVLSQQVEAKHYNYFFEQLRKIIKNDSRWQLVRVLEIPQYFHEYFRNNETELWRIFID